MGGVALGCLGDDSVLEFVEGKLGAEAETHVHEHIAGCDACRRLVAETAKYYLDKGETRATVPDSPGSIIRRAPAAVATGQTVGRYVIVGHRGSGGMGVVHEAYDPQLRRKIALKLLRDADETRSGDAERQARLLREAQAMARLSHANVVSVFDAGTYDGQVYIAMELVQGVTLAQWTHAQPRGHDEILDTFIAAGRGLAAAHAAGLVHRDFKPHNVLVGDDGKVKVTDFGLARPTATIEDPPPGITALSSSLEESLTRTGAMVGTPAYMAPEQFARAPTDAATDQFSFCVALYEALHGERPFAGESLETLGRAVRAGAVRPPPPGTTVPAPIRATLLRGLSVAPGDRFSSMSALIDELERLRSVPAGSRPRWGLRAALATAGAAAVTAAVMLSWPASTPSAAPAASSAAPIAAPPARLPAPEPEPKEPAPTPPKEHAAVTSTPATQSERRPVKSSRPTTKRKRPAPQPNDDALKPLELGN